MRICINCNKETNNDASFCQYCGTKLEVDVECDNTNTSNTSNTNDTTDIIYVEPVIVEKIENPETHYSYVEEEPIIIESETITSNIIENDNKKMMVMQIGIIAIISIVVFAIVSYVLNFNDDFEQEYLKEDLFVNIDIKDVPSLDINEPQEDSLFNIVGSTLVEFKADHMVAIVPDEVTTIGSNAFVNSPDLYKVTLPATITHIDPDAFNGCAKLIEFEFVGTPTDDMFDMLSNLTIFKDFIVENQVLVGYRGLSTDIRIPNFITKIDDGYQSNDDVIGVFSNRYTLTSVTIPNSVTYIGSNAFAYCTKLSSIILPDNLVYLGENAFYGCESLIEVILPATLNYIGNSAFAECKLLQNIEIPPLVTTLNNDLFRNCVELASVSLGNVEEIKDNVFFNCQSIENIVITPNVTKIGTTAFSNTPWFTNLSGEFNIVGDGVLVKYIGEGVNIQIPDMVKHISDVFFACENLSTVDLPETILSINENAFANRNKLTTINIPNSVVEIEAGAFQNCTSLATITIPETVQTIAKNAFDNTLWYDNLTDEYNIFGENNLLKYNFKSPNTEIPEGVTEIMQRMFFGAKDLRSVTIPETITKISDESFFGCENLINIELPQYIESIGYNAFNGCVSLTEITLPESINFIGDYAFINTQLETVYVYENSYAYNWVVDNLEENVVIEIIK